tara:strand:+ start:3909 stop:5780 length:1872 start_codon:yes stop_codon:yes gene_type:complete
MSIIEKLTEGIVNRDMKQEGAALLSKWESTGLLEGLQNEHDKNNMARLLENQAKELLREASGMGAGLANVDGFAAVAFPIVRRVFAGLIANDLVSVQPMSLPSGLIFFLDFVYSADIGSTTQTQRLGNQDEKSLYGTDKVGAGIIDGVSITDSLGGDQSGPRGMPGYAYASVESEANGTVDFQNNAQGALASVFTLNGAVPDAQKKLIDYDPDLLSITSNASCIVMDIAESKCTNPDFENMGAFNLPDVIDATVVGSANSLAAVLNNFATISIATGASELRSIRRLTKRRTATESSLSVASVRLVLVLDTTAGGTSATQTLTTQQAAGAAGILAAAKFKYPAADTATDGAGTGVIDTYTMLLENTENIPEIDIKVDSTAITAQTKKLKAKWTPELGQDLNAYHNLDAEVELTSILSEQIALEIDREILADLIRGATAATYYWSRSPGLFVDRTTGAEIGANKAAPDFTGTVSEWYETLIETINDVSAAIHRKTLRGGANFVVVSPEVANILEFTAGFRANVTADADKGDIGAVNVGSLSRKFDVIVDPYFPRQIVLVGRRGSSFLESGYVYAPYVPLQTTPTIFGPEDFVPRKGVMTRYAKKMVRPDMYGLVVVRGLNGEEYA